MPLQSKTRDDPLSIIGLKRSFFIGIAALARRDPLIAPQEG
jgi:hypothetical protein